MLINFKVCDYIINTITENRNDENTRETFYTACGGGVILWKVTGQTYNNISVAKLGN